MESINIERLKRRPDILKSKLLINQKLTMCKEDLYVLFPAKFLDKKLCYVSRVVKVLGMFAIVDYKDNYSVVNAPIFLELSPFAIEDVMINGKVYKKLIFKKDTVIIPNNDHLVTDNFMYDVFEEFFIQGNIPWYLNYDDVGDLLIRAKEYAASKLGDDPTTIEILTSIITRYKEDKKIYFREVIDKPNMKDQMTFIGLNDIFYSFNNTGARLIGGYFGSGLINAMVGPEKTTSKTSEIFRS